MSIKENIAKNKKSFAVMAAIAIASVTGVAGAATGTIELETVFNVLYKLIGLVA